MIIVSPAAKLMCEPAPHAQQDDEAWYGQGATIIQDLPGEYCRVRMSYGYESYISRDDLADGKYPQDGEVYAVRSAFADVLKKANVRAETLLTLPRGARLLSISVEDGWRKVRLVTGEEGFVRESHLERFPRPICGEWELRRRIAATALSYLGTQYRWGGRTPWGIDCSGLCHAAYLFNGIAIYRNSTLKEGYPMREIPMERIDVADLIYFPGHVAMYLGMGRYVHATGRAGDDCVTINSLYENCPAYREDLAKGILCAGSVF